MNEFVDLSNQKNLPRMNTYEERPNQTRRLPGGEQPKRNITCQQTSTKNPNQIHKTREMEMAPAGTVWTVASNLI